MRRPLGLAMMVGCSAGERAAAPPRATAPVFGDDRVADVLARNAARAPRTYREHEGLFGVGRSCALPGDAHPLPFALAAP